MPAEPLITNDAVVLGILMGILALVFTTSHSDKPGWKRFYSIVPSIFVCYFLPSLLSTFGIISGESSNLYFVASRYLLPTSLVLLTISVDLPGIIRLGPKAGIMFLAGTTGIVIGGPLAILAVSFFNPDLVGGSGPDAVWRGLTTVAGSWIGGGANQAAMKEVFEVGDDLFSAMIAVDVIVANIWMAVLLFMVGRAPAIDARTGADTTAIEDLQRSVEAYQRENERIPALTDIMQVLAVGFGATAFAHFAADAIAPWIESNAPGLAIYNLTSGFFWLVVVATTVGLVLSGTRARRLEHVGASKVGSACLWVLVVSIGMQMNLAAVFEEPGLFLVGGIWMAFHAIIMLGVARAIRAPVFFLAVGSQANVGGAASAPIVARAIRAPVFFLAVGSQANVGGAASAPIVASAVHPALAPVGALLAVLGYALGTYGAYVCGQLMRIASG